MKEPVVTVIVPAYNAERTIGNAIQSICREFEQTMPYEILIVENGSTDGTVNKVRQSNCKYIKLLHSEKGVSNARNCGIDNATGKWIMFVDADDELVVGSGMTLKKVMNESQADLCLFGHKVKSKDVIVSNEKKIFEGKQIENIRVEMLKHPTKYMQVWAKLFNRKRMIESGIWFDVNLRLAEDSDFTLQYSQHCKKIELYTECIYSYTINSDSVMHTFDGEKVSYYAVSMELTRKKLDAESVNVLNAYEEYVMTHFHIAMVNEVFCKKNKKAFSQKIDALKKAGNMQVFREAINASSKVKESNVNHIIGKMLTWKLYKTVGTIYAFRDRLKTV